MPPEDVVELGTGRSVCFADYGPPTGSPVLWCHSGPGCRLSGGYVAPSAAEHGFRVIGVDRPGYGRSPAQRGRTIADWVSDGLAVLDHLGVDRFVAVGTSTGGAYALAVAALAPDRVDAVVACCAVTDMRFTPARDTMSRPHALDVWEAEDRDRAMAAAIASHGVDGTKIIESADGPALPASDMAMLQQPWGRHWIDALPEMFAQGVEGYTDDRIADRAGWNTFDVAAIRCPVIVLHGSDDVIADPIHARHTASIVPGAELRLVDGLGHFSIEDEIVPVLLDLSAHQTPDTSRERT
jgi:pimeloyl-ACP methyl ester carboxylesterase